MLPCLPPSWYPHSIYTLPDPSTVFPLPRPQTKENCARQKTLLYEDNAFVGTLQLNVLGHLVVLGAIDETGPGKAISDLKYSQLFNNPSTDLDPIREATYREYL